MIKLEHVVLPSPEQMEFIIEGMRNPMNSWEKSDSTFGKANVESCSKCPYNGSKCINKECINIGNNDLGLMQRLANAGTDHRKFMRMMPVYVRITAPLYWWKEFRTYRFGVKFSDADEPNESGIGPYEEFDIEINSCSTMHKIQEKEFTLLDFSHDHMIPSSLILLEDTINMLNEFRAWYLKWDYMNEKDRENFDQNIHDKKDLWWQMIQLLPSSYNQTRNIMMNYEVLSNIYKSRKNHKLDEWREFCKWIEELPYSELIINTQIH